MDQQRLRESNDDWDNVKIALATLFLLFSKGQQSNFKVTRGVLSSQNLRDWGNPKFPNFPKKPPSVRDRNMTTHIIRNKFLIRHNYQQSSRQTKSKNINFNMEIHLISQLSLEVFSEAFQRFKMECFCKKR